METTKLSSITVAVRVRPFTAQEQAMLVEPDDDMSLFSEGSFSQKPRKNLASASPKAPGAIRQILDVVDDKMLIFDPPESNPLNVIQRQAFGILGLNTRIREHRFVFDRLFDQATTQEEVYRGTTQPLLDLILDGYNATVFAYGATGCGKTHTISGLPHDPGVIFLTMQELYQRIDDLRDTKVFEVTLSFLEIYNETICDLLCPTTSPKKLVLREDATNKISVTNLSAHAPKNVDDVMNLIMVGNGNRTTSATDANATLSRSHAVLQINVVQRDRTADVSQEHTFATLSIIDLAGLERAAATKNRGARLIEGANINRLLLALGNCINALCDPRRRNHVPYRDLKLTRLLKFLLGGNCKTVMIVCVLPLSQHYDETLNTLKYANRAKEIKTKLHRNRHNLDRHVGLYLKMITEQKAEIDDLRARELEVVLAAITKTTRQQAQALEAVMEAIESLSRSVDGLVADKWKKYYLLAKRKLIILQKVNVDALILAILQHTNADAFSSRVLPLCEKILQQMEGQITELEHQYSVRTEIDHLLENQVRHILSRLEEHEGWHASIRLVFDKFVAQLKDAVERDILINLLILFDHLVYQLYDYNYLTQQLVEAITSDGWGDVAGLVAALEAFENGDYDAAIERFTAEYMQQRLDVSGNEEFIRPPKRVVRVEPEGLPKRTKIDMSLVTMELESDTSFDDSVLSHDDVTLGFNPRLDLPPSAKTEAPKRLAVDKNTMLDKRASLKIAF